MICSSAHCRTSAAAEAGPRAATKPTSGSGTQRPAVCWASGVRQRIREVIAYLPLDRAKVGGMTDLEREFEHISHRENATRLATRLNGVGRPDARGEHDAPSWGAARGQLERAISRHGAGGKQAALTALAAEHRQIAAFVEHVGWVKLCRTPLDSWNTVLAPIYKDLCQQTASEAA